MPEPNGFFAQLEPPAIGFLSPDYDRVTDIEGVPSVRTEHAQLGTARRGRVGL